MPLKLVRNDLSRMRVDAMVCAGDSLSASGGVDEKLRRIAGESYVRELRALGKIKPGEAKLTSGHALPCKIVIHVAGPKWSGGFFGEKRALAADYRAALELAKRTDCETVAFPLISTGDLGFPKEIALQIAIDTIRQFLETEDLTVFLVLFDKQAYGIGKKKYKDIQALFDEAYVDASPAPRRGASSKSAAAPVSEPMRMAERIGNTLADEMEAVEKSFSELLLQKIDEKGMTDSQCCKKANIDRKLFSKIRSNAAYRPTKATALAFAIALELPLEETKELLSSAGFALSRSSKADIIVEYFISRGNFDIFEINQALFSFEQNLLGA